MSHTYKDAGVDIEAGERAVALMKAHVRRTFTPAVLSDLGTFGALYALPTCRDYAEPVLVASADGVGTKVKVAALTGRHTTVGQDLVNHCVNDILTQGAKALFFLDYFAVGKLDPVMAAQIVEGLSIACVETGCALIGGETAEMPDVYAPGEYDLAGFIVGVVERSRIVNGEGIRPGDRVIGLASNGLHTNGYTLARKLIFDVGGYGPDSPLPWTDKNVYPTVEGTDKSVYPTDGWTVADELLRVHRCYANVVHPLLGFFQGTAPVRTVPCLVQGMAHITGGGLPGNLVRALPGGCRAVLNPSTWPTPPIFTLLQRLGNVPEEDMYRTFNMGVGFTLVVRSDEAETVLRRLQEAGETAWDIGCIEGGERSVEIRV